MANHINTRIIHKHDTEANWNKATSFIPKQGEIIIYDIDNNYTYERIKIGDGVTAAPSLPFATKNAFGNVKVGSTTIAADSFSDTLTLTAGANISLTPSTSGDSVTIVATDTTYSAGNGLTLSNTTFNVGAGTGISVAADTVGLATVDTITTGTYGPSAAVTGSNNATMNVPEITVDEYGRVTSITNRVYTAKNNTYAVMSAATSSAAGTSGLVPAPAAGKQSSFLRGDGTWVVPTDTKVTQTATEPTSADTWYLLSGNSTSNNTTTTLKNSSLKVQVLQGTTSAEGYIALTLGNGTASGTAGNKRGQISIYSSNTGYHTIKVANSTSNFTHTFPAATGTLLNTGNLSNYVVPISGGTFTGALTSDSSLTMNGHLIIRNSAQYPRIMYLPSFAASDSQSPFQIWYDAGSETAYTNSQVYFRVHSYTSGQQSALSAYEQYVLPAATAGLASSKNYNILTDKNIITIVQGGTGTKTAPTQGGIIYASSTTAYASTAVGTSGQLLQSAGTGKPTWITATNSNTASTIVKRDASGNFSAGTITAALSGNASTATALTSSAGSDTLPVYFKDGKPVAVSMLHLGSKSSNDYKDIQIDRKSSSDATYGKFYLYVDASGGKGGFAFSHYNTSGAQDGAATILLNTTCLYPSANNTLSLGTSSFKWNTVYATTFSGNATSATKATQDGDGNTISSTYLKLSGGTLTGGNITIDLGTSAPKYALKRTVSGTVYTALYQLNSNGEVTIQTGDANWSSLNLMTLGKNSTTFTKAVAINSGGTGATTAASALTNLGIVISATQPTTGLREGLIWLKTSS